MEHVFPHTICELLDAPMQVTLDVKSSESGVVQALMVKAGDVVKPGQIVASISATGAAAAAAAPVAATPTAASRTAAPAAASHAGRSGMHFPTRRTAAGERISDLPADKQEQLLGAHAPSPPSQPAAAPKPAPSPAAAAPAAVPAAAVPKTVTTVLEVAPARRGLTAREVELINSGGA
jgi:pyruvate/2-oxoglutarate dehydrogenase complex dihydrolipoamide acyltransferase (E2) component